MSDKNHLVLVVDDEPTNRALIKAILGELYTVLEAESGHAALERFDRTPGKAPVDLVLLDVMMPGLDGFETCRRIKSRRYDSFVPVILLSALSGQEDRNEGLSAGADELVSKPIDRRELLLRVHDLLRVREHAAKPHDTRDLVASARGLVRGAETLEVRRKRPTILIIDDSATFRDVMKGALESAGYAVVIATSGEDGLRLARETPPDAVVVDGLLPGIDGPTVIRRLRSDPAFQRVPCLLLTGSSSDARLDELTALEAGADASMPKAHDTAMILARVAGLLRSTRSAAAVAAPTSPFAPKKLLAVDDSATYRQQLAAELRGEGYDVVLARSGAEALELLTVQPVEAILLDLVMPGLSGQETCRRIKQSPAWRDTPGLIVSARDDREAMIEGMNAGADDYIPKSAGFDVLKARLRAQIRRRQFENENLRFREELLRRERDALDARAARALAEERAARSEEIEARQRVLDTFFFLSTDLLCIAGFDGRFRRLNPAWTRTLGFTEAELVAEPFINFVHPADRDATVEQFKRILGGAAPLRSRTDIGARMDPTGGSCGRRALRRRRRSSARPPAT